MSNTNFANEANAGKFVRFLRNGGKVLAFVAGTILLSKVGENNKFNSNGRGYVTYDQEVGYDDAVRAIVEEFDFDHRKQEAIKYLKKNASEQYYRAVIYIAENSDYDHHAVEMIASLTD